MERYLLSLPGLAGKGAGGKSAMDKALGELALSAYVLSGKETGPSMAVAGSKSVKNVFTAERKGYDGG
jgi:hypothetical protein